MVFETGLDLPRCLQRARWHKVPEAGGPGVELLFPRTNLVKESDVLRVGDGEFAQVERRQGRAKGRHFAGKREEWTIAVHAAGGFQLFRR